MSSDYATTFTILQTSSRLEPMRVALTRKLRAMADLPEGWHYGQGKPVTDFAMVAGQRYVVMASQLNLKADVFPNPDGGCAVAFYSRDQLVEVSIGPDGNRLNLRAEKGLGYDFENLIEPLENATPEQVYGQVLRLLEHDTWKLSVSLISASTSRTCSGFGISSTRTPHPLPTERPLLTDAGGFQSSKPPARANT